ncbi:DoxX family protein [Streptomyces sp. HUAS TT20]|uniref:DoxX family protein n=1 Tax=Streptomyces sp. HUAS TT20 TaxID=3447509 RepID=UPI0021D880E3|nr:DoxX family protein [Streptomyces sp. HUAS 15-9]UXY32363.1 DoxX family protein [Streptomyces sp. HUAS 15-9]
MSTTAIVLAVLLAGIFLLLGSAKLAAVPAMRQAAAHVGMTTTHYRLLGALEVAAAAGLLLGLRITALGAAASVGLILLMAGAVVVHLRSGDPAARCLPAVIVGALAAARLVLLAGG